MTQYESTGEEQSEIYSQQSEGCIARNPLSINNGDWRTSQQLSVTFGSFLIRLSSNANMKLILPQCHKKFSKFPSPTPLIRWLNEWSPQVLRHIGLVQDSGCGISSLEAYSRLNNVFTVSNSNWKKTTLRRESFVEFCQSETRKAAVLYGLLFQNERDIQVTTTTNFPYL